MDDNTEEAHRPGTEEELGHLGEYWWHSWLIDPIIRGDLSAIQHYLAQKPQGLHTECPSYYDPFIVAAKQPTPGPLRLLLEHWALHPTPDAPPPNERGFPLFNVACAHGALETVHYLLENQPALVNIHARSAYGRTPILDAAASLVSCAQDERSGMLDDRAGRARFDMQAARERARRCEAIVDLLLDHGASASDSMGYTGWETDTAVAESDGDRDTVLSLAVARAGPALLRRLLDEGADAFATTSNYSHHAFVCQFQKEESSRKVTLLHLAAFYGNYSAIKVLVECYAQHGLDVADTVTWRDQFGRLPIHYAAAGWPGALGAVWHSPDPQSIDTWIVASDTDIDVDSDIASLLRLLTNSGNPRLANAPDQYSETPLHYAVSPNLITDTASIGIARFLCTSLHASGKLRGHGGETPLHRLWHDHLIHASSSVDNRLAAMLLDLGEGLAADINDIDNAGNTPLHLAARCLSLLPAARFLLGRGADVRMRNTRGRTPLHEAAGGQMELAAASTDLKIKAQDAMLAILSGNEEEELALDKNWKALMDEEDADGLTARQIAQKTRKTWWAEQAQGVERLGCYEGEGNRKGERKWER